MEQTTQKKRVAVYCRIGAAGGEPSVSYTAQEAYYTGMIGQNPDWELAGIYADKGIASTDRQEREEFKRMIAACQQGKIDIILAKSISRFSRNTTDCLETVRMLKAKGVGVIFEKEGITTLSESGERFLSVFCDLTRRESEAITQCPGYPMVLPCRYGCIHVMGRKG